MNYWVIAALSAPLFGFVTAVNDLFVQDISYWVIYFHLGLIFFCGIKIGKNND